MAEPKEDRREQIFAAGAQLFAEKGYERTSLQEVADRLGVTKPALYYYYRSKEDLLFEIMSFCIDHVTRDITDILARELAPPERLAELVRRYVRFFTSHPHELTILSTAVDSLSPGPREVIVDKQRHYLKCVRRIVAELQGLRSRPPLDETAAAFALLGMMNWIFKWYDPRGPVGPERLAEQFCEIYLHGVLGHADR
ncbi:MAG: TetR/AcrR family transcriptional regulator [Deferrisomatales bacterium]